MAQQLVSEASIAKLLEETKQEPPPAPEPVGQCPYCHWDLERREVHQRNDVFTTRFGQHVPGPILVFWGCTNDECRLMYWSHPRAVRH